MTVFRDAHGFWMYDFQFRGKRFARRCLEADGAPANSRRQAEAIEAAARTAARLAAKGQTIARPSDYTLVEAVAKRADAARDLDNWPSIMPLHADILDFFGALKPIREIDDAAAAEYKAHVKTLTRRIWIGGPGKNRDRADTRHWRDTGKPLADRTRNAYLVELGAILSIAADTRLPGSDVPVLPRRPKIALFDLPKRDPTPVPLHILAAIEAHPATPAHLRDAVMLVRLFGLRRDEAFAATTAWIDWDNGGLRVPAEIAKNDSDDFLPANEEARALLMRLAAEAEARRQAASGGARGRNTPEPLIVYRKPGQDALKRPFAARPIKDARGAWHAALDRVGADRRYRFHDVRATYITQIAHVAPDKVTQDLARHANAATTARYVKLADDAKKRAVEMMPRAIDAPKPGDFARKSPNQESQSKTLRRVK